MVNTRTTARGLLVLALFGLLAGTASAIPAPEPPAIKWKPPKPKPKPAAKKQIVFPVLGAAEFSNDFGSPRPQGRHEGIDILAPRHALALAAEPGRVRFHTGSWRAGCMLYLDGRSGTTYVYIHLNNDLTDRNDNRGGCVNGVTFPRGLKTGARVQAGQPVGYVGDSGDADGLHPHLHFEVHPGGRGAANPYPYLLAARRLLFVAPAGREFTLALTGSVVSAKGELLRLRVNTLRAVPTMGITLRRLDRPLTLTVPAYATIERGPKGATVPLTTAKAGDRVTVSTEPATVTPDAQAGKDGVIAAERVTLPIAP